MFTDSSAATRVILDTFWLRDQSPLKSANLLNPTFSPGDVEDLEAALEQFHGTSADLEARRLVKNSKSTYEWALA